MSAIIPGFEYDIFISYRHNDNLDGWVTDFVQNLEKELKGTIKGSLDVYFDKNPHDGLLETHNVDKSLEGKLKCLIFIPIISQTYCDSKSFAWRHEFVAFNKLAMQDQFGKDITLTNGNVASRILPIKIHDLDAEDKATIEEEIGGALRAIEFIFKSPGVNRPLRANEDHPGDNQNKIFYRDQINKVANAIKELNVCLQSRKGSPKVPIHSTDVAPSARRRIAVVASSIIVLSIMSFGYYYFGGFGNRVMTEVDKSIAVLPFVNMSNDKEQEPFSDGMTDQIITNLAKLKILNVIGRTSVMHYKGSPKTIPEIAKELNNVSYVLEGSIQKSGNRIKVNAQLIRAKDNFHQWAEVYDRELTDIFAVQDELSEKIAQALLGELESTQKELIKTDRPANIKAYEHYLRGFYIHKYFYFPAARDEDFNNAESEFKKAIQLDSGYSLAYTALADLYDSKRNIGIYTDGEKLEIEKLSLEKLMDKYSRKGLQLGPDLPYALLARGEYFAHRSTPDIDSAFYYEIRAVKMTPNDAGFLMQLASEFNGQGLYLKSIELLTKCVELEPSYAFYEHELAMAYGRIGDSKNFEKHVLKYTSIAPNSIDGHEPLFFLAITNKDLKKAELELVKMKASNPDVNFKFQTAILHALKGEKKQALELSKHPMVYSILGMKQEAFDLLAAGKDSRYLILKSNTLYNNIRTEPSFNKILEDARVVYEQRLEKYAFNF